MVKIEEILEKAIPIAVVAGVGIWLFSQIMKPRPELSIVSVEVS